MRARRGTTLVELLVYIVLMSMMLTAVYAVFVASMRYFRVAQAATELQNDAQQCTLHMVADLADSTSSTVVTGTGPIGIVFLSPRNNIGNFVYDSSGNLYWQKWVGYYFDSTNQQLIRKEVTLTTAVTTVPTNPYTTATFAALTGSNVRTRTIATDMTALSVGGTTSVTISATFERSVFSNAAGTNDNRVQITDQVKLRN